MRQTDLKDWMVKRRWTVRGLAERLDVHPSTLQRYRTGELDIPRVVELALRTVEREDRA